MEFCSEVILFYEFDILESHMVQVAKLSWKWENNWFHNAMYDFVIS